MTAGNNSARSANTNGYPNERIQSEVVYNIKALPSVLGFGFVFGFFGVCPLEIFFSNPTTPHIADSNRNSQMD